MSKPKIYVYDPTLVTLLWRGIVLTGYAQDSKIEVAPKEDRVNPIGGVDGDHTYNINANQSGTIKILLMCGSVHCAMLTEDAQNVTRGQLVARDANADGGFITACDDCVLLGLPVKKRAKNGEAEEFTFFVPQLGYKAA